MHIARVWLCASHCIGSSVYMRASFHIHAIHGERLIVSRCFLVLSFSVCLSFTNLFSSHIYLHSDLHSFFHVDSSEAITTATPPNEEFCPLAEYTPPTESIKWERTYSLDTICTRVEFGRVTWWLQTLRSWKRWTHRKSTPKDSMQRKKYFPKKIENFIFPVADGRIKFVGGDQELRTSTLIRERPIRGESHVDFLGESEGSPPPPLYDSFLDAGEATNDSWSKSGNFTCRHHVEPRIKLYSPREESFPIPLKYIDVSRTTHTNFVVMQESRIDDCWNIDGSRDLSDSWPCWTQFTLLSEKPPDGYMWSGERLTRKQLTSRPDYLCPEFWTNFGNKCLAEGEAKVVQRKTETR